MSQPQQPQPEEEPQLPLPSSSSQHVDHPPASSSSRPSSAGSSTKRPAPEDDISELIRKAKASRYAQPVRKPDDDDIADTLERDLSCAICSEVLTNPVACIDCLHNFCGSCLVPWLERINTCPTCRQVVKKIRDNHSTAGLIETLLTRFPDKRRDPDELKELEKVYKPGQKVYIEEADPNEDDDDDDRHSDEDGEDEDGHIPWPPCPCCVPGNPHGFDCPEPIPNTNPPRMADTYSYRNHVHCRDCPNTIPTTWKTGYKCESCGILNCGAIFNCAIPGVIDKPIAHISAILPPNLSFQNNLSELRHFEDWRVASGTSYLQIAHLIYAWLVSSHGGRLSMFGRNLTTDSYMCKPCVVVILQQRFMDWWCAERALYYPDNRPKCWYGWGCRTQFHNHSHAQKLQHCCAVVPEAERRQGGRGDGPRLDVANVVGPIVDLGAGQAQNGDGGGVPPQQQQ